MRILKRMLTISLALVLATTVFSGTVINARAYTGEIPYYESIPESVYAITDEPVSIYYKNIISRPEMTIIFGAPENVRIEYYNNKVVLTATEAGDYHITWHVYDENFAFYEAGEINFVARNKNLKDMTVLVLGDSTVNAGTMTQEMLDLFEADGSKLTLLGTRGTGENLHEGRDGWRSYDYCELQSKGKIINPFYNNGFDFAYYMNSQGYKDLDAVVVQLGINDIKRFALNEYSSEKTLTAFDNVISSIKSYDKKISIVISLTIPPNEDEKVFENATNYATPEEYRTNIIRFVGELIERYKNMENLYFSATNCSINTAIEIKDVVHPTEQGYKRMAQTHVEALNFVLNKDIASEPTRIISSFYEGNDVTLNWVPMSNVEYYEVVRSDLGVIAKTTEEAFKDSSVKSGRNYEYLIRTHFKDGLVFDSKPRIVNVLEAPVLKNASNHVSGVKIMWNEIEGVETYIVYRKKDDSSWSKVGSVTATSFIDKKVVDGSTYTYTIKAKTDAGITSFDEEGVSCCYVATPKLSSATNKNNYVHIKWKAVKGAEGYYVYKKTSKNGKWKKIATTTDVSYKDKNVTSNDNCYYTVRAYNGGTLSSYVSSGVITKYLSVPKLSKISSGKSGVTLNYGAVKGAKNYYIYRKTSGGSWKKIAAVAGNKTYYLDKSAVKGTKYAYTVRAVNGKYLSYYNTKGLVITDRY